jgi:CDP-paratose 2-epimerase
MKLLITGAAGFVGTNAVLHFFKKGWQIVPLDSFSRRGAEINASLIRESCGGLNLQRCEIEDIPARIYIERPDLVFHFAAQVAVTSSVESPLRDFKINAEGSFNIARAASEVNAPIIYTSTNKVYGDNVNQVEIVERATRYDFAAPYQGKGLPENFSIDSKHHTPYGISKLVGELYVREFGGIANRCSCMYGPNQFGIVDQGWISHIATNKILNRPTVIYGDGKQVRDLLHVSDVIRLLDLQAVALTGSQADRLRGEVFNVGGGAERTISLIELCDYWGIKPCFESWRPADQKVFYCDISKAHETFGWVPEVPVRAGLDEIYAWTERSCANRSG